MAIGGRRKDASEDDRINDHSPVTTPGRCSLPGQADSLEISIRPRNFREPQLIQLVSMNAGLVRRTSPQPHPNDSTIASLFDR